MGLDNIPVPYPCECRGYAVWTRDGKIDCEKTSCPFKRLSHICCGILGTLCWLRGGAYDRIVCTATNGRYTLWRELRYDDLREILEAVRKWKGDTESKQRKEELINYLETLLREIEPCKDKFTLVPWG